MADDAAEEEMTPWYDTGVVWYGSLRGGLQFGGGKDARFTDGASRWGIKGSGEVSEGLTATYNFEHNISTADGSQPSGRFANVGLSGGFGTLALGQIGSASYGGTGAIVDNSIFYGNSYTDKVGGGSSRHGSAVSYSLASGPVNFQLDAIIDGAVQSDSDVDRTHLGASIALGDFGKVAISHVTAKDTMMDEAVMGLSVRGMTVEKGKMDLSKAVYWNKDTGDVVNVMNPMVASTVTVVGTSVDTVKPAADDAAATDKTLTAMLGKVVVATSDSNLDLTNEQVYKHANGNFYGGACAPGGKVTLTVAGCDGKGTDYWVSSEANAPDAEDKTAKPTYKVRADEDGSEVGAGTNAVALTHMVSGTERTTTPGIKSNHVAAEFGFGGVTAFLGHSQVEGNASGKKDKVTHYGLRGPIGESGLSFLVQARSEDLQHSAPMDADRTPYLVSLSKSLGGGASVYFEHGTQDAKDEKAQTYLGLFVGF